MSPPRRHQQVDWTEFETARTTTFKPVKVEEQDRERAEKVLVNMPWITERHWTDSRKKPAAGFAEQRAEFYKRHGDATELARQGTELADLREACTALKQQVSHLRRDLETAERALDEFTGRQT